MSSVLAKDLIEAGVHFGHRASRWNPKMRPYIYARRNLIHIIDVRETVRGLLRAKKYLKQVAADGSLILFVGTKRQAAETIEREALRCGMPFVSDRWLGGTLTNFRTIRSRLSRLEELEKLMAADELATYSKKMQSALNREYPQDVPQPERHPHDEPPARVPGGHRSQERKERGQRSPQDGHHDRGADRHRQRSGHGRSADSGQRRQHPLDRADRCSNWPTRCWKARPTAATEASVGKAEGDGRARRRRPKPEATAASRPKSARARPTAVTRRIDASRHAHELRARPEHGRRILANAAAVLRAAGSIINDSSYQRGRYSMAEITAAAVKALRERTGLPMMECKKALRETGGDEEAAVELLRKQGNKTQGNPPGPRNFGRPDRRLCRHRRAASGR